MSFVDKILQRKSVSIVGLAKNAGKTEVLNYVLREASARGCGRCIAVTSIGLDGESVDRVSHTPKPEIEIYEGMIFATSETHYRQKRLVAEVLEVGARETALGRVVTARALSTGKVMLSGPPDTESLRGLIGGLGRFGVQTTVVDGALSRLSHGSPAVTEGLVLVTGAAVSGNIPMLVRETKYVYDRVQLEAVSPLIYSLLAHMDSGVWAIDEQQCVHDLEVESVLVPTEKNILRHGNTIYVAGAVGDRLLEELRMQKQAVTLIIRDFTRIFATPENYYAFLAGGGCIRVLLKSELLAVCSNPVSPKGFSLDAEALVAALEHGLDVAVYDVKRM